MLAQESDGQISLVMPEAESIEKQITGQMNIEDILAEWERKKKENLEKREEEVRQHVLQQTGAMFTEFEQAVRDGLLEKLEKEKAADTADTVAEDTTDTDEVEELEEITEEPATEEPVEELTEAAPAEEAEQEPVEELPEEDTVEELAEEPAYEPEAEEFEEPAEPEAEIYEQEEIIDEEQAEPEEAMDDEPVEEPTAEAVESVDEETASEEIELTAEETPEAGEAPEQPERPAVERDKAKVRALTREERELYAPFIQSRSAREQLVKAIDNISLAAYTGNVIITGEEGMDTLSLAKNMVREIQATDSNFSGKVAKISGHALNKKDTADTLSKLKNGALIICKASEMNDATANVLHKALQQESQGIVIILEDTIPATAYLEYERSGNRKVMEVPYDANRQALNTLMLAELAEGKGRFIDQLLNGAYMSCEMNSWVLSAHLPRQSSKRSLPDFREQIIDLGSGGSHMLRPSEISNGSMR